MGLLIFGLPARAAFAPSAEGAKVAVACDHGEATRAALETLHHGGNAVDGAITAALALGVVNPSASGIGGGGFALVYIAKDKKVVAVDFRETAPEAVAGEDIFAGGGRGPETEPAKRGAAIGVPGEPAGLEWLSQHYGRVPLNDAAAPAISIAAKGFPVGKHLAVMASAMQAKLTRSPELASAFLPGGSPLGYRTLFTRPELARTLTRFGKQGARPFYDGDIAAKILKAAHDAGSNMQKGDLAGYQVKERAPLMRTIDGRAVYTMPAPSAGGLMLLETLSMYGASDSSPLKKMGHGSSAHIHTMAEAMRGAIADRARFAGDPDLDPQVAKMYEQALDPNQIAARRARIKPNQTHPASAFRTREHGTSHVIVGDADGNVVALTTTINVPFGARVVAGDTGILLNDELDDFSSPKDIQGFGVVGLGPNRPRGKARPVSSMTPTIVLENGLPILAIGGSGGTRIATGVTQAAVNRLIFGLDPSACVSAPRVHVSGASNELLVDPEIAEDVRAGLRARGETVKDGSSAGTAVQMVVWERSGNGVKVLAASDPRKFGLSAAE